MNLSKIKFKVAEFHEFGETVKAANYLFKKFKIDTTYLKGFEFRENAKPEFILMTTEGNFGELQSIRIPKNTFQYPLNLMLCMLCHEMVHVTQKSIAPFVLDKNEREWQAYYEMLFRKIYPNIPEISNFHKKFFASKAFEYYDRMGENSELQKKYAAQKIEVASFIKLLE